MKTNQELNELVVDGKKLSPVLPEEVKNYLIDIDGTICDGRPIEISGAHAQGHNKDSIGVCYVGGVDEDGEPKDTRTDEQKEALLELIKDLKETYTKAVVFGHRDFSS
jgi:N-acetylmuramoyl-L-alanine amidase